MPTPASQHRLPALGLHDVASVCRPYRVATRDDIPSCLRLLSVLGCYHHEQIPVQMFYNSWSRLPAGMVPDYLPWKDMVSEVFDYRQFVQESISLLAAFSLITRSTDASLSLRLLVYEWCRDRLAPGEQQLNYRRALWLLTDSVRWEPDTDDYMFRRSLVSHVHELIQRRDRLDDMSEEDKMQRWPTLALILAGNGWTEDALPLMETVMELQKSKFGTDHAATLWLMHSLAIRYSETGRLEEALQLTEQVVERRKSKLGAVNPDDVAVDAQSDGLLWPGWATTRRTAPDGGCGETAKE